MGGKNRPKLKQSYSCSYVPHLKSLDTYSIYTENDRKLLSFTLSLHGVVSQGLFRSSDKHCNFCMFFLSTRQETVKLFTISSANSVSTILQVLKDFGEFNLHTARIPPTHHVDECSYSVVATGYFAEPQFCLLNTDLDLLIPETKRRLGVKQTTGMFRV